LLDLIARIIGSYAIAALTAGIFFGVFSAFLATVSGLQHGGVLTTVLKAAFNFLFVGGLAAFLVAELAFVPFIPAIIVLRALGLRGWAPHGLAGLLVSAVVVVLLPLQRYRPTLETLAAVSPIILMGGIAGVVYWAAFNYLCRRDIARGG
jgi:hypothetical protein